MTRRTLWLATLILLSAACSLQARSHHRRAPAAAGSFDYYLLSLSYAPDFCDQPGGNKNPAECGAGRHTGFVVHGLWPQGEDGRGPERCGSVSPVSEDIVSIMLNYIPTASLIQHEWTLHGSCTGLAAADYFALVRKARDSIAIPNDLKAPAQPMELDPHALEAKFAAANKSFPKEAFRASCYGNAELQETRICFGKNLGPRACSPSAGSCSAPIITVLPVR